MGQGNEIKSFDLTLINLKEVKKAVCFTTFAIMNVGEDRVFHAQKLKSMLIINNLPMEV
jgi:hypothetical protein